MEDLMMILIGLSGLAVFAVLAVFLGHDSRDGFGDSYHPGRWPASNSVRF